MLRKSFRYQLTIPANTESDFSFDIEIPTGYNIISIAGFDISETNKIVISKISFDEGNKKVSVGVLNTTPTIYSKQVIVLFSFVRSLAFREI